MSKNERIIESLTQLEMAIKRIRDDIHNDLTEWIDVLNIIKDELRIDVINEEGRM